MNFGCLSNQFSVLAIIFMLTACGGASTKQAGTVELDDMEQLAARSKGPLLATHFTSLEDLKRNIQIEHQKPDSIGINFLQNTSVTLKQKSYGQTIHSILEMGITEEDVTHAKGGSRLEQLKLLLKYPYFIRHRQEVLRVYVLARRFVRVFGDRDAAFFYIAENMLYNIADEDFVSISSNDLSEKGYLNTFNHITSQVFITAIFSEELADFIGDMHERANMIELITGEFSSSQLDDLENGPIDNYVDMINNEWGQELGKKLKNKYHITKSTVWTTELLVDFLNDIQAYYSWAFQLGFEPFHSNDERVIFFTAKLNVANKDLLGLSNL